MDQEPLRLDIEEAADALRISRALLYRRIKDGELRSHKDGGRTYIALAELRRYADSKAASQHAAPAHGDGTP